MQGNYTALITPFKKNLTIDYEAIKKLCLFQVNNSSDGIVALGSTAEASSLDIFEKHKTMETIVCSVENKIPIIAGINAFTLEDALYQSKARFLDGANALLISPPPYIKPTEKGLKNYFLQLADQSLIPIILYNIPSRTGTQISESLVTSLSNHPNIIGIKDAGGNIAYTQNICASTINNNFSVFAGNDNQLLPILSVGGTGIISVIGNIIPKEIHQIVVNYNNNLRVEAKENYFKYLELINSLSVESNPIPVKYALSKLGVIKTYFRAPLCLPSAKNKRILKSIINKYFTNIENNIYVN